MFYNVPNLVYTAILTLETINLQLNLILHYNVLPTYLTGFATNNDIMDYGII